MTPLILALAATILSSACALVAGGDPGAVAIPASTGSQPKEADGSGRTLKPFDSERELRQAMDSVATARRIAREKQQAEWRKQCLAWAKSENLVDVCSTVEESLSVALSGVPARDSITNTQHPGVDEGGIVKRQGDVLIILRRGRLFTIGIGGEQLDSLAVADASGPVAGGVEPDHTWYDELLVWEQTVIVIGFSYSRGGTEIGLFDLGASGDLRHRATYHLRSYDYYSLSNYASRLIGERLALFTTFGIPENTDPDAWLPAIRRSHDGEMGGFESITSVNRVFRPVAPLAMHSLVHTMVICNMAAPSLTCEATVVLGDAALTVFYASPTAGYLWTTAWTADTWTTSWPADVPSRSVLYRMPFDGAPVAAVGVMGIPPSQLAFFEDTHDHLNVVVSQPGKVVTLLRLPLPSFSDGSVDAPASHYRPIARGLGAWVTTRFVGPYVLVGARSWDGEEKAPRRIVVSAWEGEEASLLRLTHDAQRIEAIGAHAVVVGSAGDSLSMTAIRLDHQPRVASVLTQKNVLQSEDRSHAFFYREDGPDAGVFGLPIVTNSEYDDPQEQSAQILFVRNRALTFTREGTLDKSSEIPIDDDCRVSCADWYGNVRPVFIDDRIFALLGYEIVEGRRVRGRVEEVRRLDFTPRTAHVH